MLLCRVPVLLLGFVTQSNINELLFHQVVVVWLLGESLKIGNFSGREDVVHLCYVSIY